MTPNPSTVAVECAGKCGRQFTLTHDTLRERADNGQPWRCDVCLGKVPTAKHLPARRGEPGSKTAKKALAMILEGYTTHDVSRLVGQASASVERLWMRWVVLPALVEAAGLLAEHLPDHPTTAQAQLALRQYTGNDPRKVET